MALKSLRALPLCRSIALALFAAASPLGAARAQAGACRNGDTADVVQLMTLLEKGKAHYVASDEPLSPNESETGRETRLMVRDHVTKYTPAESLHVTAVRGYCRLYTKQEIKALSTFYSSPLGQKALSVQAEVADSLIARLNALMLLHRGELMAKGEAMIRLQMSKP